MANGWQSLGQLLGGGSDRQVPFMEGQRYRADTEYSFSRAREAREAALRAEQLRRDRETFQGLTELDPVSKAFVAAQGYEGGTGAANQFLSGHQERGFRERLSDPTLTPQEQLSISAALTGDVSDPYYAVGSHGFASRQDPTAGVMNTPLSEEMTRADIARTGTQAEADRALAAQRYAGAELDIARRTGLGQTGTDPTTNQRQYQELVAMGTPPDVARGVAYGMFKQITDNRGLPVVVDFSTGQVVGAFVRDPETQEVRWQASGHGGGLDTGGGDAPVAVNPATGERVMWDGTQWQPIR